MAAEVGDSLPKPELGWKRYDDTDPKINYGGSWLTTNNSPKSYHKTAHFRKNDSTDKDPLSIKFSFKGTKLRIIALRASVYQTDAKILIDGKEEIIDFYNNGDIFSTLVYEKTGLDSIIHKIEIYGTSMHFDAIDIDEDGYLVAKVGDSLPEPEPGWKRYDDTDSKIIYSGNWNTVTTSENNYNKTSHYRSNKDGSSDSLSIKFSFKGTKLRIIALRSSIYQTDAKIFIDGKEEVINFYNNGDMYTTLVYEKINLDLTVHKVEIYGTYMHFDAIDIDSDGELLVYQLGKPKNSLYEKESGKLFVDSFDSLNPKWLMSSAKSFDMFTKKGFLRINHTENKDVMLLIDKPQGDIAIQVIAEYSPIQEGDAGGLLIYQTDKDKIEFLSPTHTASNQLNQEWMAVYKSEQWDFYHKSEKNFDYISSDQLKAKKIGVVLKKGMSTDFSPLDVNKIVMTTSNLLRLRQLYEKYQVILKDAAGSKIAAYTVENQKTGIDIPLPSLEFDGEIEIYDEDGKMLAKRKAVFYGGDMYCMGSSLHISIDSTELDDTDPTHLGYMPEKERLIKMTLSNDNISVIKNVHLKIEQYMEKIGYTWASISIDGNNFTQELLIESMDADSTKNFFVKITKDVNHMSFEPIYFNIHLSHE
ncbi:hypothetical protein J0799_27910 [Bacillus paranthracis]